MLITERTFDAEEFLPEELRELDNPQTVLPAIAKDVRLTGLIDEAVSRIPTSHVAARLLHCFVGRDFFFTVITYHHCPILIACRWLCRCG